jgi:hypothetical protein
VSQVQPPEKPDERDEREHGGLLWRVVRSALAPEVLEDGGRDAPLTPRGKILFWGTVVVLVIAISILFVITLAER